MPSSALPHDPVSADLLDRFPTLRVGVLGDAMLDTYLLGQPRALCREAPVPIVDVVGRSDTPGGGGNTAQNASALGAQVSLFSVVGDDDAGQRLRGLLGDGGVDIAGVFVDPTRETLRKERVLAAGQMVVRCDSGSTDDISDLTAERVIRELRLRWDRLDVLIVSDYGYGVLSHRVRRFLMLRRHERAAGPLLVVDAKDLRRYRGARPAVVKPNYGEATALLGLPARNDGLRAAQIEAHAEQLLNETGADLVAVTMDTEGALLIERDASPYRSFTRPRPPSRVAGAGDTFTVALGLSLAAGSDTPTGGDVAAEAAAAVLDRDGTAVCALDELRLRLAPERKLVEDPETLDTIVATARETGSRIVFTNGCFDILHRGHVSYLARAKALGDLLIVGLNDDEGVRRLKGEDRPINRLHDRAAVLAALSCVDVVVPFAEDDPSDLIRRIRPEHYVKGGDYVGQTLPEADVVEALGGRVHLLPFMDDRSTTRIIERIRSSEDGVGAGATGELLDRGGAPG